MIDLPTAAVLPAPALASAPLAPAAPGAARPDAARFGDTLGALLGDAAAATPSAAPAATVRQALAENGKTLPLPGEPDVVISRYAPPPETVNVEERVCAPPITRSEDALPAQEKVAGDETTTPGSGRKVTKAARGDPIVLLAIDPASATIVVPAVIPVAAPPADDMATPQASERAASRGTVEARAALAVPAATTPSTSTVKARLVPTPPTAAPIALPPAPPRPRGSTTAGATEPSRASFDGTAQSAILVGPVPQPARAVFAAAIAAAYTWRARDPGTLDAQPLLAPLGPTLATPALAPTEAIDLRDERGLRQVIDRIETLRDDIGEAADARDTRIRLAPDRLGVVDIAVRREGDAVRVHFTAERETTQALLLDAQPRLADLAAQRGVRITEASVSTGTSPDPRGTPQQPRSPHATIRAAPAPASAPDTTEDTRLA